VNRRRVVPAQGRASGGARLPFGATREASLVIVYGTELGRRVPLTRAAFTIGRSSRCDLFVDQEAVSRRHAKIVHDGGAHTLHDLGSSNGTRVNDVRVTERVLVDGDRIQIGQTLLAFLSGESGEARFQEEIHRLMTVDGLTGVYNKRYFRETLDREYHRALRYDRQLSLVVFEVDGLAALRERHGAVAVDAVLPHVAASLRGKLRQHDIFGRTGEAAFAILLPEIGREGALKAAEKARVIVESTPRVLDGVSLACTISLGVATLSKKIAAASELVSAAQQALEEGRHAGDNRVTVFEDEAWRR